MAFKMNNTGGGFKMMGSSPAKMASPMKQLSVAGDPVKGAGAETEEEKQALIDNAMPSADVSVLSEATFNGMKSFFGGVNTSEADVVRKIAIASKYSSPSDEYRAEVQKMKDVAKARYPGIRFSKNTYPSDEMYNALRPGSS